MHRTPPGDLTPEEWWLATRTARHQVQRELPGLRDVAGQPLVYAPPDEVLRRVEMVARNASGTIGANDLVTNPSTRNRSLVSSLIEESITSSQLEGASTSRRVAKEMIRTGRPSKDHSERGRRVDLSTLGAGSWAPAVAAGERASRGLVHNLDHAASTGCANRYVSVMTMPEGGHRTVVTALAACLLLTACTDGSAPTRTPPPQPTATATPTASPTPTPSTDATVAPQRPEAMATPSADGAAAAASYFISLFPYIFATGDLTAWDGLSASDCQYCQNTRASVEDQLARGVRGAGSEIDVISAAGTEISAGDTYAATVEITQAPSFEVSEDGTRRADGEGGTYRLHLALWWRDGWIIRAVDATRV